MGRKKRCLFSKFYCHYNKKFFYKMDIFKKEKKEITLMTKKINDNFFKGIEEAHRLPELK